MLLCSLLPEIAARAANRGLNLKAKLYLRTHNQNRTDIRAPRKFSFTRFRTVAQMFPGHPSIEEESFGYSVSQSANSLCQLAVESKLRAWLTRCPRRRRRYLHRCKLLCVCVQLRF